MTLVNPDPFFVVAAAKIGTIKINEVCRIIDTRLYYAPHTIILFLIAILIETVKLLPHICYPFIFGSKDFSQDEVHVAFTQLFVVDRKDYQNFNASAYTANKC